MEKHLEEARVILLVVVVVAVGGKKALIVHVAILQILHEVLKFAMLEDAIRGVQAVALDGLLRDTEGLSILWFRLGDLY